MRFFLAIAIFAFIVKFATPIITTLVFFSAALVAVAIIVN